jgi:tellurite resistance protein TerC
MTLTNNELWIGFAIFVVIFLAIDMLVLNRTLHEIRMKEALMTSALWIGVALLFGLGVYYFRGGEASVTYYTAYVVEESLSMDNMFVFLMIFSYFKVPPKYQHKILFWGIIGAVVMRFIFIFAGITLISKFHWFIYIFGAILIYSGYKMIREKDSEVHPDQNPVIRLFRKFMPVTSTIENERFFVKQKFRKKLIWHATPLFIVLLVIETSDVIFAVDSIPAVLSISQDTFIVFTSNIMAILGLRSLYFALAGVMQLFRFLHYGLSLILIFVGIKMVIVDFYEIPIFASLGFICLVLALSIGMSALIKKKK